jgi:glycine/D-amino acid oxidase-like deaminating enzyme
MFLDDIVFDRAISVLGDFYGQTGVRATHAWGGPIDVSADKLPFAGRLSKSEIYFCAGYTAHGVNPSWIMGNILSSLVCHQQDKWTTSLLANRKWRTFPPEPFRSFAARPIQNAIIRL